MTPDEEIKALTYAILRLEAELQQAETKSRRDSIMEIVQVIKQMRVAIIAKEGLKSAD